MIRFSVLGIPIQIQPFFWVTLAIIGGALGADSSEAMMRIGLFVIAGFVSILIHELGHALTGRAFGAQSAITLQAFGGFAAFTGMRFTRTQSFLVTLAGPAVQLILGLLVMGAAANAGGLNDNSKYFLWVLMVISFFWALLNLLPVLPLDGGQLLNAILGPKRIKVTLWTSVIVAVVFAILFFQKTGSFLFPIFLGMFAWQSYQALRENSWR